MEGGRRAWGPRVGAHPTARAGPSSLTLFFASLVLPDPERGTMPIYLLPPPTPGPEALKHPSSPILPCPFLPAVLARCLSPRHACLSTLQPEGSTHRTPEALEEGVGVVGLRLHTGWHWETLRCPSSNRDFAYVARDKLTQMLKCHVFRCEAPAKNIATSLHEICSKAQPAPPWITHHLCPTRVWAGSLRGAGGSRARKP